MWEKTDFSISFLDVQNTTVLVRNMSYHQTTTPARSELVVNVHTGEAMLRRLPIPFLMVASQWRSAERGHGARPSAVETSEAEHRFYAGDCFLLFQGLR